MILLTNVPILSFLTLLTFLTSLLGISIFKTSGSEKNFVLIGKDGAANRTGERADTIIITNVNKKDKIITLISIPRDSKVIIPCGPNGNVYDKIAHSLYYGNQKNSSGGETCVAKTIKNMFDLESLPYISIAFNGIRDIVNKVGGVEIVSPFSFCQEGKDGKRYCFTKNTKTKVSGDAFLAFVRHRKTFIRGDFDRTYNQRVALTALFNKIKDSSNFDRIRLGVYSLTKVKTNLDLNTITTFAKLDYSNYTIKSIMLEGTDMYASTYYYQLDKKHLQTIKNILNSN